MRKTFIEVGSNKSMVFSPSLDTKLPEGKELEKFISGLEKLRDMFAAFYVEGVPSDAPKKLHGVDSEDWKVICYIHEQHVKKLKNNPEKYETMRDLFEDDEELFEWSKSFRSQF